MLCIFRKCSVVLYQTKNKNWRVFLLALYLYIMRQKEQNTNYAIWQRAAYLYVGMKKHRKGMQHDCMEHSFMPGKVQKQKQKTIQLDSCRMPLCLWKNKNKKLCSWMVCSKLLIPGAEQRTNGLRRLTAYIMLCFICCPTRCRQIFWKDIGRYVGIVRI